MEDLSDTNKARHSTMSLAEHVQTLPPEIYNMIYGLTFSPNDCEVVTIDDDYEPPIVLEIDQKSRHLFAERYYGCAIFRVAGFTYLKHWLSCLSQEHRSMLRCVRIGWVMKSTSSTALPTYEQLRGTWLLFATRYSRGPVSSESVQLRDGVLQFEVTCRDGDGVLDISLLSKPLEIEQNG